MDTSLKLLAVDTGAGREYQYDVDEQLLWVTDFGPDMHCVQKRRFHLSWNPIDHIRQKAMTQENVSLKDLDIDA